MPWGSAQGTPYVSPFGLGVPRRNLCWCFLHDWSGAFLFLHEIDTWFPLPISLTPSKVRWNWSHPNCPNTTQKILPNIRSCPVSKKDVWPSEMLVMKTWWDKCLGWDVTFKSQSQSYLEPVRTPWWRSSPTQGVQRGSTTGLHIRGGSHWGLELALGNQWPETHTHTHIWSITSGMVLAEWMWIHMLI